MSSYRLGNKAHKALLAGVKNKEWRTARELFDLLKTIGYNLLKEDNLETAVVNIFLRVCRIVREECLRFIKGNTQMEDNLVKVLFHAKPEDYLQVSRDDIYESILEALNELKMEIHNASKMIAMQALQHVHTNEVVLTFGYSSSAFTFLQNAVKKGRKLTVLVAQASPENSGFVMAEELRKCEGQVNVELLPDTHLSACMSRVNKVVVGCHAIYADGSFRAPVGIHAVVLAAQTYRVPVCVCFAAYKVSPLLPTPQERLCRGDAYHVYPDCPEGVEVVAPKWDFIPQHSLSLLITNLKGYDDPSNLFHLIRDSFHREDVAALKQWMQELHG